MADISQAYRMRLRELLLKHVVSEDLRLFCFDLGQEYETIVGPNDKLQTAIIAVIQHFEKREQLAAFVTRVRKSFPMAAWDALEETPAQTDSGVGATHSKATPPANTEPIQPRAPGPLRIFLCHASDDKPAVRALYAKLIDAGTQPWLDEEELLPGQKWRIEIPKAIQRSDVILACVSNKSVQKAGYVKNEMAFALDIADKQPDDAIFVIPVRLEECPFPERLGDLHGVNLYDPRGYERLMRALHACARALNVTMQEVAVAQNLRVSETLRFSSPDPLALPIPNTPLHIALVRVPAGEFLMGSDKAKDSYAYDDEMPQHRVYLDEYLIGKTPITVAQFAAFAKATSYKTTAEQKGSTRNWDGSKWDDIKGANWQHPFGPKSDVTQKQDHPVTCVSWDDATAFCKWLSDTTKRTIALPTEAQREKAARGTDGRIYPWGNDPPDATRCNFNMNVKDTTPVGHYSPHGDSPFGAADMAGNVWDWCSDWYNEKEYGSRGSGVMKKPTGPARGEYRVVRGGSWSSNPDYVRTANRLRFTPDFRINNIGFRVVVLGSPLS